MKECADELVLHLHNTHQDTQPINSKVEDLSGQWRDLQAKLRELSEYLGKGKLVCALVEKNFMHTLHELHVRLLFCTFKHALSTIQLYFFLLVTNCFFNDYVYKALSQWNGPYGHRIDIPVNYF